MGFLTTVTIYNDQKHHLLANPQVFVDELIAKINEANERRQPVSWGGLIVEPSRHADDHTIYVHYGNTVFNLNPYCKNFQDLMYRPEILQDFVNCADGILKDAKKKLKEAKLAAKLNKSAANKK